MNKYSIIAASMAAMMVTILLLPMWAAASINVIVLAVMIGLLIHYVTREEFFS